MSELLFPEDSELCPNAFTDLHAQGYEYAPSAGGAQTLIVPEKDFSACARQTSPEIGEAFADMWPCGIGRLGGCAVRSSIGALLRRERQAQLQAQ